jgi:hypothetical protein
MRLMKLYYRAGNKLDARASKDFQIEEIRAILKQLATRGVQFEIVETSTLPDEALMEAYLEAVKSAVLRKYRVRQVFGSQRHPGRLFGKEVPALVVYENHVPSDVYPHEEGGRIVTIREFLEGMLHNGAERATARQAAARMDERRARLGPIGVKVSELIREGRHR